MIPKLRLTQVLVLAHLAVPWVEVPWILALLRLGIGTLHSVCCRDNNLVPHVLYCLVISILESRSVPFDVCEFLLHLCAVWLWVDSPIPAECLIVCPCGLDLRPGDCATLEDCRVGCRGVHVLPCLGPGDLDTHLVACPCVYGILDVYCLLFVWGQALPEFVVRAPHIPIILVPDNSINIPVQTLGPCARHHKMKLQCRDSLSILVHCQNFPSVKVKFPECLSEHRLGIRENLFLCRDLLFEERI